MSAYILKWRRCPHVTTVGIYGDRILFTPKWRRLHCVDCGRDLDGPVSLRTHDQIGGAVFPKGYSESRKAGKP